MAIRRVRQSDIDPHDLDDYMREVTSWINSEYERITRNSKRDPGTAGDEGEENWAELFRGWLPPTYHIVTKGRVLAIDGQLSDQIDVLILHPNYPRHLHGKKKYLLPGVLAAFECKLTLNKSHIYRAVKTAATLRRMGQTRCGTPYSELYSRPVYGLLAHSHAWKSDWQTCTRIVTDHLAEADETYVKHPREMVDFVCIPGLATWTVTKDAVTDPEEFIDWSATKDGPAGCPYTTYFCHCRSHQGPEFTPVGILIAQLLVKLAWEDESLRALAGYLTEVQSSLSADGRCRAWSTKIFTPEVRQKIKELPVAYSEDWNEWSTMFD